MSERKGIDWEPDAVSIQALQAEQPPGPVSMARWIYRARLAMTALIGERDAALAELTRLRSACVAQSHAIEQTLGRALGYPAYQDDLEHFPGATETAGVCVADHTAESLADEAATELVRLQPVVAAAREHMRFCGPGGQDLARTAAVGETRKELRAALVAADKGASRGAD